MNLSEERIQELRKKKKWRKIAEDLQDKNIENELDEEEKFIDDVKKGKSNFERKLRKNFDEYGTQFTAFNMREEIIEGNFDQNGHYLFKHKGEEYDPWYDSVKDEIMKKEQQKMMEKLKKKRNRQNNNDNEEEKSVGESSEIKSNNSKSEERNFQYYGDEDLYYKEEKLDKKDLDEIKDNIREIRLKLIDFFITDEENVNAIIKRLNPKIIPEGRKMINKRKRKEEQNLDESKKLKDEEVKNKIEKFKILLDYISKLTELSHFDIYYDTYRKIARDYGERSLIKWRYRVIENNEEILNEYGDYSTKQINEWNKSKYFAENEKVKFEFQIINRKFDGKEESLYSHSEWFGKESGNFLRFINE